MKKVLTLTLVLAGMVACTNDTIVNKPTDEIAFAPAFVEIKTRAAVDPSITTATIDAFDVWGFMDNTSGVVFDGERVSKGADGWSYEDLQYWAPGHNYYFGAIAPVDHNNITVTTSTTKPGLGKVTFTNIDGSDDLIYASKEVITPDPITATPENVKLQFAHLLSKIKFTFTNGFANKNATIKVTNIQITDAPKTGSIDLAQEGYAWSTTNDKLTLSCGDGDKGNTIEQGKSVESDLELLTIPTDNTYTYNVSFDVELFMGNASALTATKTTTIENQELKIGKNYNFKATLNHTNINNDGELCPIVFEVIEVKNWVEETQANTDLTL